MTKPIVLCQTCIHWQAKLNAARGDCAIGMLTYPWCNDSCVAGSTQAVATPTVAQQSQLRGGPWAVYVTGLKP